MLYSSPSLIYQTLMWIALHSFEILFIWYDVVYLVYCLFGKNFLNEACSVSVLSFCLSQQHLRKWMEVVVITHKGGQRSDGSVSIHSSDSHIHMPHSTEKLNTKEKLSLLRAYRCVFFSYLNTMQKQSRPLGAGLSLINQTALSKHAKKFPLIHTKPWSHVVNTSTMWSPPRWVVSGHITIND